MDTDTYFLYTVYHNGPLSKLGHYEVPRRNGWSCHTVEAYVSRRSFISIDVLCDDTLFISLNGRRMNSQYRWELKRGRTDIGDEECGLLQLFLRVKECLWRNGNCDAYFAFLFNHVFKYDGFLFFPRYGKFVNSMPQLCLAPFWEVNSSRRNSSFSFLLSTTCQPHHD